MLEILLHPRHFAAPPQVIAIINAARPLRNHEQVAFLNDLVIQLAGRDQVGDGELGRMLARLQRLHFKPPSDADVSGWDAQYRHMDGAVQAHIDTRLFWEMRQRQEAAVAPALVTSGTTARSLPAAGGAAVDY